MGVMKTKGWVLGLGLALAAAGCSYEAGYEVDTGTFGNAAFNNEQVQTGAKSYVASLNDRFASEVPPTITFDFDSATLDSNARPKTKKRLRAISLSILSLRGISSILHTKASTASNWRSRTLMM